MDCDYDSPELAIVLGSGMGGVARRVAATLVKPFAEIPGLDEPAVQGHAGRLLLGDWAGRRVLVLERRLHYYEGRSWSEVVRPIETAASLGAKIVVLTNAAGGIHESLRPGSVMAVRDHIEWTQPYCWRCPGPAGLGPARPSPYSPRLLDFFARAARDANFRLHSGVYAAVTGPCYETPAEIRALKAWGADAVGMSTAREAQAAFDLGLECAGISCITNRAAGLGVGPITHTEVLRTMHEQSERVADLLERFLRLLD